MIIKFLKLNKEAIIPKYAHPGDAGMDLYSLENKTLKPDERYCFKLGFATEFSKDYCALVWDKGSLPFKAGVHTLAGVVDSTYRGEYIVILINLGEKNYKIEKGDKIAQLLIQPIINAKIKEVKKLSETSRGEGRFGSTGRK
jgi:dUTP pyrophosphatase